MPGWLQAILIAVAVVVASWLLLIVLARRLPPGLAKDLAAFLPDCVTTARLLRRDPRVPRRAKVAVVVAMLWVLSPIDLLPEFLPVIGPWTTSSRGAAAAVCGPQRSSAGPDRRLARRTADDRAPARPGRQVE